MSIFSNAEALSACEDIEAFIKDRIKEVENADKKEAYKDVLAYIDKIKSSIESGWY